MDHTVFVKSIRIDFVNRLNVSRGQSQYLILLSVGYSSTLLCIQFLTVTTRQLKNGPKYVFKLITLITIHK